jgi:hypothetical protein
MMNASSWSGKAVEIGVNSETGFLSERHLLTSFCISDPLFMKLCGDHVFLVVNK